MPKELPKVYEPSEYEDSIYKAWETAKPKSGYFNPDNLLCEKDAKTYTIVLPPPNVTGTLHMGHAGMLAYEDVLIRYHRMRGERALWVPGTDHAAIATQTKVEKIVKEEGETRHSLGRDKFLSRVRQFAQDSHDTIVGQCRKMGSSLDWSREAYTLDETRNKAVNSVFKLMYDDGLIYRGERIVNWCPRCQSTLADDEVEHKETKSKLYYFKYSKDFPLEIATTRPETKLGDTAVAVNPKDKRYKDLIGKEYDVDFVGVKLKIKIIADRSVDMKFGAGAVGVTPAHSMIDWQMAENNDLPVVKVIDEEGIVKDGFGEYSGLSTKEARVKIVENLNKADLIIKEEEMDNNLSICYRCDATVEPLPSLQWFIDVNKKVERLEGKSIKEICLEAIKKGVFGRDKIKIVPERFEKNYFHWMENLRDWCISRQIWFGHQVPVWYKDEEIYVGVEAPEGEGWTQDEDTLDTWFSSGMWTFSTLAHSPEEIKIEDGRLAIDSEDFRNFHPTQVLETGYDILFFWVARMIIMTTYAVNDVPFEDVYLHGLVLDDKGKKMSKSKGNVIDPLDMIKKYGTDATRLSLIVGSAPGSDLKLSEEKVAGFRNLINKIWNVARYIVQKQEVEGMNQEYDKEKLTLADKWILAKLDELSRDVTEDIEEYRFSQAGERLREFTWDDLADWYLEATKFDNSTEKDKVLLTVLKEILILWHPFIPFVTEVIWGELGNDKQLIISSWPEQSSEAKDEMMEYEGFEIIKDLIASVRNARAENKIEPSKKVKAVIYASKHLELIKESEEMLMGMRTGIEEIELSKSGEDIENAIYVPLHGIEIYLIGAIDPAKEKERIHKEIDNIKKQVAVTENKLSNEDFVNRAPEQIVAKEKNRLESLKSELKNLEDQFSKL